MKKYTCILLLILLCFGACKKDITALTQGQLAAQKMARELGVKENVSSADYTITVYTSMSIVLLNATSCMITSEGFINVYPDGSGQGVFLNLAELKYYTTDSNHNLILYF